MRAGTGSTLEAAVADTVGAKVVELEDVIASDLVYDAFLARRDLRVSGNFRQARPWERASLVVNNADFNEPRVIEANQAHAAR